ncbi:hypothetical protein GCM10023339_76900 [Alloalcanivorax gelatiniphagus]
MIIAGTLLSTTSSCASGTRAPAASSPSSATSSSASGMPTPTPSTTAAPVAPAQRAESVVVAQAPRSVTLPSGRTARIDAVGTTAAGLLDVPDDIDVAGWWRGGSRLGDPFGSILVAAHVDSRTQGLGPFAELLTVDPGARVVIASAGLRQAFEISARRLVPQRTLLEDSWILDASGPGRLTLVTCAPPYDASRGGYQHLAVVTAVPLGPPEQT